MKLLPDTIIKSWLAARGETRAGGRKRRRSLEKGKIFKGNVWCFFSLNSGRFLNLTGTLIQPC